MSARQVTIVGAGLVGALLATLLAQRGFAVDVFERRTDPRKSGFVGGRSINLALAERGWQGLRIAGLQRRMQPIAVMMRGRMVHHLDGHTELLHYGRDDSEVIWSVNRGTLNQVLIEAAEAAGARIHFDQRLSQVDWDRSALLLVDEAGSTREHVAPLLIGADGAGSALRAAMARVVDLGERYEPLDHSYKELEVPALNKAQAATVRQQRTWADARFAMEPNALHIWPRGNYMCIALPNAEGSFTVTLFLPNVAGASAGSPSFASVNSEHYARAMFARAFADLSPLIPELAEDFMRNPTGMLGTLYLNRWHVGERAVLLGDAAHAIVPFHGQGMNCGFEDAVELADLMDHANGADSAPFATFQQRRKPNADAIAAMALDNYVEMRDSVADSHFLLMRALERVLAARHPGRFVPRYWMVTFSRMPYALAYSRGDIQSGILRELATGKTSLDSIDLTYADVLIASRLPPLPT